MKVIIGAIFIFIGSLIGFWTVFTNIDMTGTRLLIEFWDTHLLMIILVWLGLYLVTTDLNKGDKNR